MFVPTGDLGLLALDAACRGRIDLFFGPAGERGPMRAAREAQARALCERCPHRDPCREQARARGEYGFWGGESEDERAGAGFPPVTAVTARPALRSRRAARRAALAAGRQAS